jgi:hypothetical protein
MSATTSLAFSHCFEPGADAARPLLLLLHGTGSYENDLLLLGKIVARCGATLAPRQGARRRHAPLLPPPGRSAFNQADLHRRTEELAAFILAARDQYGLPAAVALGFSNGANIVAAPQPSNLPCTNRPPSPAREMFTELPLRFDQARMAAVLAGNVNRTRQGFSSPKG